METYGSKQLRLAQAELTSEDQVNALFGQNLDEDPFGSVEVIVVNHGAHAPTAVPVKDMSLAQWEHCVNSNLTSTFLVVREYLNALENVIQSKKVGSRFGDRASVVFVGSTAGKFGEAGFADYASNKSGKHFLFHVRRSWLLTLSMRLDRNDVWACFVAEERDREDCTSRSSQYRRPRLDTNSFVRGSVEGHGEGELCIGVSVSVNPSTGIHNPDHSCAHLIRTIPLRKVATTEDIASQIVLLASAKVSGHVSGQVLMVDGGMEGRLLNLPEDL